MRGKVVLHIHERVLRALPFVARGASRESLLVYSKLAAFLRVTQGRLPPPFIHWLLCATWNIYVGTSSWFRYIGNGNRGIRASLCVPQDERVFLSLAPEVLQGMDCVTSWQQPSAAKTPRWRQWEAGGFNKRKGWEEDMWKFGKTAPIRRIDKHPGWWLQPGELNTISVQLVTQDFFFFFLISRWGWTLICFLELWRNRPGLQELNS